MKPNPSSEAAWPPDAGQRPMTPGSRTRARAVLAFYAASADELPKHRSLIEQRFREVSAVVVRYLEACGERPAQLSPDALVVAYRLALDLHGIVSGSRSAWSREWLLLFAPDDRLHEAAQVAEAYRPHAGPIPATRMAALRVSTELVTEISVWHNRAAKPACAPDFASLLQAAAIGLALHQHLVFAEMSDFEILKLVCDAHHQYGELCWSQAQPTAPVH